MKPHFDVETVTMPYASDIVSLYEAELIGHREARSLLALVCPEFAKVRDHDLDKISEHALTAQEKTELEVRERAERLRQLRAADEERVRQAEAAKNDIDVHEEG